MLGRVVLICISYSAVDSGVYTIVISQKSIMEVCIFLLW